MKTIPKRSNPPEPYVAWLSTPAHEPAAMPIWDNMPGTVKAVLDHALLTEQGHVCCYCGGRIGEQPGDHHVEHMVPGRAPGAPGALDYANLLASCGPTGKPRRMQHCGEHKGDDTLPVTPLQPHCASHFRYTLDGRIKSTQRDAERAQTTISVLNLTESLLTRNRAGALRALDGLDDEGLRRLRRQCHDPRDHRLEPYCFVLAAAIDDRLVGPP